MNFQVEEIVKKIENCEDRKKIKKCNDCINVFSCDFLIKIKELDESKLIPILKSTSKKITFKEQKQIFDPYALNKN